jgi:CHAT domain-containing protein/tetratricopeptide (TPR) repeat protein
MTNAANADCPTPETLAAFAEGRLRGAEAAAVVEHLDTCEECSRDAALAMRAAEEENVHVVRPRRWSTWIASIAAAVVIALLLPVIWQSSHRSPVGRLVALSSKSARIVEPRLSGGFAWSPYRGSQRASGAPVSDPERMKLAGAAGELVERAQHDSTAGAQHDAGLAMVLTQNPVEGIARLEKAAKEAPTAQTWSDLAAARYAAASDLGRAALYPQALAAADAALKLDPHLPEALFNRALIVERMGLVDEARAAWTRYLAADPSSKWADEARSHLAELPATAKSSRFEHDRPALEQAVARGDTKTVDAILSGNAERAHAFAEAEYLGRWGDAVLQKDAAGAARWLTIARAIAGASGTGADDALLRDALQAIERIPESRRDTIAAAHAAYRSGRIAYSRQQLDDAIRDLERAAALFADAHSPMALAARYYVASVHQAKQQGGARSELERVLAGVDASAGYRSLRAHVRWEVGRARMFDYDWPGAAAILNEGAAMFREAGDRAGEAAVETTLAYCLAAEGRGDESWISRIQALRALSAEGNPARMAAAIGGAARAERAAGRDDAALALARIPQPVAGDGVQLTLVLDMLQFESMLQTATGNAADALRTARHAAALAQTVRDASLRSRAIADANVAAGAALAVSDRAAAAAPLTAAIDYYRQAGLPFAMAEPLLLRAQCAARGRGTTIAAHDLEEGMQIVERHRRSPGSAIGTGVLDADHELFSEAVRLNLDRGNNAAAFAIAERSRGASITIPELQQRLAGSATAVVEIVVLREEVVTFAITENDLQITRRQIARAAWAPLVDASLAENGTAAAAALYDDLVRPADQVLARVRGVIFVPDRALESVPFAALYDSATGRYLVERVAIAIASSAGSLQREELRGGMSVATVALPTSSVAGVPALPEATQELGEIAALYRRATVIGPDDASLAVLREALASSDVVHVSGHTEQQGAGGEHALLLSGANGAGAERASARLIAATPLPHAHLLVLAACETLRPPASAETNALSLGGAFNAAGVPAIIGTLTPVDDRDARTFFRTLHRHLAGGEGATEALRAAQITAIQEQKSGGSYTWRSVTILTSRIHASKG